MAAAEKTTQDAMSPQGVPIAASLLEREILQAQRLVQAAGLGFLLMTGRPDRSIISRGHLLGMNNFIAKPFTTQGLKGCIEKVVGAL